MVTGSLPQMSRDAADGRVDDVRRSLSAAWRLTAVGIVLAAAGLVALGPDLTGVLYAASKGGTDDARYIGLLVAAFGLGLPAFSAQYVALRGFYAFEDTRTPFLLQVVIAAVNVGLALLAYSLLPLEAKMIGVAVAYSATYLRRAWPCPRPSCGAVSAVWTVRGWSGRTSGCWSPGSSPGGWPGPPPGWPGRRWPTAAAGSAVALAAGGVVLLATYVLLARLLRVHELTDLAGSVRGTSPALSAQDGRSRPPIPSACPRSPPAARPTAWPTPCPSTAGRATARTGATSSSAG